MKRIEKMKMWVDNMFICYVLLLLPSIYLYWMILVHGVYNVYPFIAAYVLLNGFIVVIPMIFTTYADIKRVEKAEEFQKRWEFMMANKKR